MKPDQSVPQGNGMLGEDNMSGTKCLGEAMGWWVRSLLPSPVGCPGERGASECGKNSEIEQMSRKKELSLQSGKPLEEGHLVYLHRVGYRQSQ